MRHAIEQIAMAAARRIGTMLAGIIAGAIGFSGAEFEQNLVALAFAGIMYLFDLVNSYYHDRNVVEETEKRLEASHRKNTGR